MDGMAKRPSHAIVRPPSEQLANGELTHLSRTSVDVRRAIAVPVVATADLVTLLETRAAPLREARPKRNRGPSAVVRALPARP